jgi:OPT family oligopeptide transporter
LIDDPERRWLREVHRPGQPELTARAVATGMVVGGLLCLTNVYVVLKTGWSLGVALTSSIVAYGAFRALAAVGVVRRDFGPLENGITVSVASAAAFMTGGGNMAALPALLVVTGARPSGPAMALWFAVIAALGVVAAIPIKRQLVNIEALPFPSSVATAETIRSMHAGRAGAGRAKLLGAAGVAAGLFTALRDAKAAWLPLHVPGKLALPLTLGGHPLAAWSLSIDPSPVLIGGGALMGARTAWSMALGALATYGVVAPALVSRGLVAAVEYKKIVEVTLWPGAALLVASALVSFAMDWRAVARSVEALVRLARSRGAGVEDDPMSAVEAPTAWFVAGLALLGPIVVVLLRVLFGVPVWAGVASIPLALLLAVVAARVTGETDITPTKAIGPATQLAYGAVLPGDVTANIMSGNVTGGVGLHAADLLSDMKTGWVLGVTPRKQVVAQLFGVAVGAVVVAPAFALLVPSADVLGTPELPAPAVMVWAGVSKVMAGGVAGLAPAARVGALVGLAAGALLATLERALPRHRHLVPSAAGLGIAMVMPASTALTMCVGAAIGAAVRRARPAAVEPVLVPVASGAIAGESLVGIALVLARTLGLG